MSETQDRNKYTRHADDGGRLGREALGLLSIFLGLLGILSLATFDGRDPWLNHVVSSTVQVRNKAGLFGAYLAGLFYDIVGAGAWSLPAFFCLAGIRRILGGAAWPWWRWTGFLLFSLSLCLAGAAVDLGHVDLFSRGSLPAGSGNTTAHGGGIVGHVVYTGLVSWMGPLGAFLVWFFSLALALQMLTGISLPQVIMSLGRSAQSFALEQWERHRSGRVRGPDQGRQTLPGPWSSERDKPLTVIRKTQQDFEKELEPLALAPDSFELPPDPLAAQTAEGGGQSDDFSEQGADWPEKAPAQDEALPYEEETPSARADAFAFDADRQTPDFGDPLPSPLEQGYPDQRTAELPAPDLAADSGAHDELVHPLVPRSPRSPRTPLPPQSSLPPQSPLPPQSSLPPQSQGLTESPQSPQSLAAEYSLPPDFFGPVEQAGQEAPAPAEQTEQESSGPAELPSLSLAETGFSSEEEELPPWVRDFEMDRIGVASASGPATSAAQQGVSVAQQGAPATNIAAPATNIAAPAAAQAAAPSLSSPAPLAPPASFAAGPDLQSPAASYSSPGSSPGPLPGSSPGASAAQSAGDPAAAAASDGPSLSPPMDDEDLFREVWGREQSPDASGGPDRALPFSDSETEPHLSARTAVAVEALRSAARLGPDPDLRPGPHALTLDSLAADAPHQSEPLQGAPSTISLQPTVQTPGQATVQTPGQATVQTPVQAPGQTPIQAPIQAPGQASLQFPGRPMSPQQEPSRAPQPGPAPAAAAQAEPVPDGSGAVVAGPEWAAAAFEDDVPIFESPAIEQTQAPGAVARLVEAVARPRVIPLPALDLLQSVASHSGGMPREVLEEKGRSLMTCLKDFGVQGELVGITPGPVVTMFEVRPAPGVRVSRISNLSDDLALALKAVAVRIQAPVPGTDTVGIEIPNETRETVCLKELLGSRVFAESKSLLTLALGKDIAGNPAVADLATMPHLLVAGATGAGKSVGINSIILSLLYKARPEEVQLLLVDPKRVEMAIYADLPHLVHPVVTEMQLAKNALEWAVAEMERRYDCIARAGVRNIGDYNAKIASFGDDAPEALADLEFMPYLVLIIDELADLMLVAAKEVENSIVRLAQLARAAGIHLILATQRPSVDVVTGLIKANFPCRISFQVTSKHDSRTILDTVGAEHLLGKGDMLFKPAGGKSIRMHGAFVRDRDVNAVVGYWKSQQPPRYRVDFANWAPESGGGALSSGGGGGDVAGDPLYNEAVDFVRQQGKASISLIQRKFRIGFNKAARYIEQMEADGIIGPADGSKPRTVIG